MEKRKRKRIRCVAYWQKHAETGSDNASAYPALISDIPLVRIAIRHRNSRPGSEKLSGFSKA